MPNPPVIFSNEPPRQAPRRTGAGSERHRGDQVAAAPVSAARSSGDAGYWLRRRARHCANPVCSSFPSKKATAHPDSSSAYCTTSSITRQSFLVAPLAARRHGSISEILDSDGQRALGAIVLISHEQQKGPRRTGASRGVPKRGLEPR